MINLGLTSGKAYMVKEPNKAKQNNRRIIPLINKWESKNKRKRLGWVTRMISKDSRMKHRTRNFKVWNYKFLVISRHSCSNH